MILCYTVSPVGEENYMIVKHFGGFPGGTSDKEATCQHRLDIRDAGSIPGSGRSPGGGHGNLLQYSCLETSMDRGAWWATVYGVAESNTTEVT